MQLTRAIDQWVDRHVPVSSDFLRYRVYIVCLLGWVYAPLLVVAYITFQLAQNTLDSTKLDKVGVLVGSTVILAYCPVWCVRTKNVAQRFSAVSLVVVATLCFMVVYGTVLLGGYFSPACVGSPLIVVVVNHLLGARLKTLVFVVFTLGIVTAGYFSTPERFFEDGETGSVWIIAYLLLLLAIYVVQATYHSMWKQLIAEKKAAADRLSTLLFILSNELRTPMQGIVGVLDMLEQQQPPQHRGGGSAESLRILRLSVETMSSLYDEMRDQVLQYKTVKADRRAFIPQRVIADLCRQSKAKNPSINISANVESDHSASRKGSISPSPRFSSSSVVPASVSLVKTSLRNSASDVMKPPAFNGYQELFQRALHRICAFAMRHLSQQAVKDIVVSMSVHHSAQWREVTRGHVPFGDWQRSVSEQRIERSEREVERASHVLRVEVTMSGVALPEDPEDRKAWFSLQNVHTLSSQAGQGTSVRRLDLHVCSAAVARMHGVLGCQVHYPETPHNGSQSDRHARTTLWFCVPVDATNDHVDSPMTPRRMRSGSSESSKHLYAAASTPTNRPPVMHGVGDDMNTPVAPVTPVTPVTPVAKQAPSTPCSSQKQQRVDQAGTGGGPNVNEQKECGSDLSSLLHQREANSGPSHGNHNGNAKDTGKGTGTGNGTVSAKPKAKANGHSSMGRPPQPPTTPSSRSNRPLSSRRAKQPLRVVVVGGRGPKRMLKIASTLRILVVDDDALIRTIMQRMVKLCGHLCTEASDGEEAVRMFERALQATDEQKSEDTDDVAGVDAFDLIVMDLQLPGMDGFTTAARLRELGVATPIVAFSAGCIPADTRKAREMGLQGHYTKPMSLKLLRKIIPAHVTHPKRWMEVQVQ